MVGGDWIRGKGVVYVVEELGRGEGGVGVG